MFTLLALCAGLTAIRMAIEHRFDVAIAAIVLAAVLDGLDGRVARLLKASSRFGAELDSLADFVNFGVAPAIVVFTWALGGFRSMGWIVVLVFAVCAALRLARFNVALDADEPDWKGDYFVGVPAPAGALIVMLPLYVEGMGVPGVRDFAPLILAYTLGIALLMVSFVPTYSGKLFGQRVAREYVLPVFVLGALFVAVLLTYPYKTMTIGTVLYLAVIPLSFMSYRKREAEFAKTAKSQNGSRKRKSKPPPEQPGTQA
ncbi:MAG: CDP-diacylglycerol--serine O-phosphatidyltransferase [Hyphomicrobiaceae bacterium]|nr:CDP-diacylglycerol--serine O-phosphatidyltransferase [Hyphomicrobiaceae bacterium]